MPAHIASVQEGQSEYGVGCRHPHRCDQQPQPRSHEGDVASPVPAEPDGDCPQAEPDHAQAVEDEEWAMPQHAESMALVKSSSEAIS